MTIEPQSEPTPYERGYAVGYALKPGPAFPTPDSSWAERLYARGWSNGVDARRLEDKAERDRPKADPITGLQPGRLQI